MSKPPATRQKTEGKTSRRGHKKGENIKAARKPGTTLLKFGTDHYVEYNWEQPNNTSNVVGTFRGSFSAFDNYVLLTGEPSEPLSSFGNIPFQGIRLDDRWAGRVTSQFKGSELAFRWPAEFDTSGMLRATRIPLGDPCLIWVEKGELDIDGKPAKQDGCYYAWYRGLQLLCGAEGLEDLFSVRPSHEALRCKGLTFKREFMAAHPQSEANFGYIEAEDGGRELVSMKEGE